MRYVIAFLVCFCAFSSSSMAGERSNKFDPNRVPASEERATLQTKDLSSRNPTTAFSDFVSCVCEAHYAVGDRVVAASSINVNGTIVAQGSYGTVVCGHTGFSYEMLVSWDGVSTGHDGNGLCGCPSGLTAAAGSGWWVHCTDIAPAPHESVSTVCSGAYAVGTRVVAKTDAPGGAGGVQSGDRGTVICGDSSYPLFPILVSWDGWTGGHDGNGTCVDPGMNPPEGVTSAWWVPCDDIAVGSMLPCVCGGVFERGDRIRLLQEDYFGGPTAGQLGHVVCGTESLPHLLVSFDDWSGGHDGNGNCSCPSQASLDNNSGYFVDCDKVGRDYGSIFIDGFTSGDTTAWAPANDGWCPDDSVPEHEACEADGTISADDPNGGCNSNPVSFGWIAPNVRICGTVSTYSTSGSNSRDTDWFEFSVASTGSYSVTVFAQTGVLFGILNDDCNTPTWIVNDSALANTETSVTATLDPGTYRVFVATSDFSGIDCGSGANRYWVRLDQR